jgi:hypothetical protein
VGKSSPTPPPPPDPHEVAQAQTGQNIGTSVANTYMGNANTYGPLGNVTYDQTGTKQIVIDGKKYDIPLWSVNQTLSRDQQRLLDLQEKTGINLGQIGVQQSRRLGNLLNTRIDPRKLPSRYRNAPDAPELQTEIGANDFSADRQRVEEALFARQEPQFARDRAAMETRLANQGVTQGSQAYMNAMDELNRSVTDARMQTVLAGGQEQSRLFGMDQAKGQFHNSALGDQFGYENTQMQNQQTLRQQYLQELMALRNQPISEITALMGGSAPTIPGFQPFQAGHIADVPVGQYMYQTAQLQNQQYAQQVAQQNAAMGGMAGLGSSFLSAMPGLFSDRRLKENIQKVGRSDKKRGDLPIFTYNYKGDPTPRIGFMAQDVEKKHPEAVHTHPSGYKMVRYDLATEPVQ